MLRRYLMIAVIAFGPAAIAAEPDITINMKAVEDLVGGETAAKLATKLLPEPAATLNDRKLYAPLDSETGEDDLKRGESLQLLYARGNLVISPSGKETLEDWADSFLRPNAKVEILSYSGSGNPAWAAANEGPGQDIQTYSLHEAIRTAFKRALVVRDILIEKGVPEANITLRALGPTTDNGPPERIDVVALKQG